MASIKQSTTRTNELGSAQKEEEEEDDDEDEEESIHLFRIVQAQGVIPNEMGTTSCRARPCARLFISVLLTSSLRDSVLVPPR